ncbi:MAG TPA: hypothetical protein PJ991_01605 [Kiritimatiellia bacterium]|nr:hypothetical protein [Kiritimatiellia bacterium]
MKWFLAAVLIFAAPNLFAENDRDVAEDGIVEEATIEVIDVEIGAEVAEESADEVITIEEPAQATPKTPTFVVIVPERIDHNWYWILYSDRSQHIVQSAIEKALIRAGVDVIDLTTASLPSVGGDMRQLQTTGYGMKVGKQLNADYVVSGQATAVMASEGRAYGVNVVRTQAEVSARIIRVSDGKILTVEDASVLEGGQSSQAAGQNALKKAGATIGSKLARTARELSAGE